MTGLKSGADRTMSPPSRLDAPTTHTITIAGTSLAFPCAENDVLVRAALRAGIDLPYECNMGGCGACKLQLTSGEVETVWPEAAGLTDRDRRKGHFLGCQARPLGDCSITLRTPPAAVTLPIEHRPHSRSAVLRERRRLSPSLMELEFATDDEASFLPGQYALLTVPGLSGPRAYSMANAANPSGRWRFIIRRVASGAVSPLLFESLRLGDRVTLDAPYGRAYWRPQPRNAVCVAGGSGLAPMLAVAAAAKTGGQPVAFFYGTRDAADIAAVNEMTLWGEAVTLSTVVSEAPPGWTGQTGLVHHAVARAIPAEAAALHEYYLAGPAPMTEEVLKMLAVERRVPFEQIHFDRFT
jgi:toluene monooxygenase electron transfer component